MDCTCEGFKCSRGEFRTFWTGGRIARDVSSHLGRCWIITDNNNLVAYVTLLADKLTVNEPILGSEDVPYKTFPAIKIGLLASDKRARKSGTRLVEWALEYIATELSPLVGVRFVTVDALYDPDEPYDSSPFYTKQGFRFADPDEPLPPKEPYRAMYFDLLDLIEGIEKESA
jgi:GNAT superfamily N-acetyltransferase